MKKNSVVALIAAIKLRPAMYLGRGYISCLKAYLDGWQFMAYTNSLAIEDDCMSLFQDWLAAKYRITTSHSWASIILFYSQDECSALQDFFDLFEEWQQAQRTGL